MYGEQAFALHQSVDVVRPVEEVATAGGVQWQASLFADGQPTFDGALRDLRRIELDASSWVDHLPRWLDGSDTVFADLLTVVPWYQRTVPMYDRMVKEPRLVWWWTEADGPAPLPILDQLRRALRRHYDHPFDSVGCNYYRTGADSVAWHGDRMRLVQVDPLVAIVSVGAPRPFLLRPRGGGRSRSFLLGHGDLLVMGGAAQHDWEHSVPKVAAAGPRISITYRHAAEPPAALRDGRARHPSAGAQNRHLPATGSANGAGRLQRRGADIQQVRPRAVGRPTEGPPS
jgi:alkylated DNA repair dioxygenase AlkB